MCRAAFLTILATREMSVSCVSDPVPGLRLKTATGKPVGTEALLESARHALEVVT